MRKRTLSVRTTAMEGRPAVVDDGEVLGEPVSPSARLVDDLFIVAIIGLGSPVNLSAFRAGIGAGMACHPRFHSIQVRSTLPSDLSASSAVSTQIQIGRAHV